MLQQLPIPDIQVSRLCGPFGPGTPFAFVPLEPRIELGGTMLFRQLIDPNTSTYTYLLADPASRLAILIDPVASCVDRDIEQLESLGLILRYTIETHVHADHVTGAHELRERLGCEVCVPAGAGVQGADVELTDGQLLFAGVLSLEVRHTPGHTGHCISLVTGDRRRVFTGDTLFVRGCGRTDFQGGSSEALYRSVHTRLFTLPDSTEVWPGHDYRGLTMSTIGEEKARNPRLKLGIDLPQFQSIMGSLGLSMPAKIHETVPKNLRLGGPEWPTHAHSDGFRVAAEWVAEHTDEVRIVDVRTHEQRSHGAVHGESIELDALMGHVLDWDRSERIVTVCEGDQCAIAADALKQMGFRRVAAVCGSLDAG